MKKNLSALLFILTIIFPFSAAAQSAAVVKKNLSVRRAAAKITAVRLRDYLYFLASDEMAGRLTGSRELDIAAKFIELNLARWGLKPAGDDGTYFQNFAVSKNRPDNQKSWVDFNGQRFASGEDFLNIFDTGTERTVSDAPVVFVGNGWMIKSKDLDPYKGVDIKGKIIAVFSENSSFPPPAGITSENLKGERGIDYAGPLFSAKKYGAAGVLILPSKFIREDWETHRQLFEMDRDILENDANLSSSSTVNAANIPAFLISPKLAATIFSGERFNPLEQSDYTSFELSKNKKLGFSFTVKRETLRARNVVALWEGSDPHLKAEMVALGAHYDHIGNSLRMRCMPAGGDSICNGADDDGSGTTALLAIAEALSESAARPKRSILFVWHSAEEVGLLGSRYFTNYSAAPVDKIIAQLNLDMIGRSKKAGDTNPKNKELSGENEVYVIGSKMMSAQVGEMVESVNKSYLNLKYNYKYDDPKDPNRFFFRADHFYYAAKGIPTVYWFNGEHEDYHGVGDEPDKIDYAKMEKITHTVFLTMWRLADLKSRPLVDKQLPPD